MSALMDVLGPKLFFSFARHKTALAVICAALVTALVIGAALHHIDRDAEQLAALVSWQRRAKVAEAQVAEIVRTGDGGLVLARIQTRDLGLAELRIRPVGD